MIGGLDRPTSGDVVLDGTDLAKLSETKLTRVRSENIGFVFQSFNLIPTLTALENITLPMALGGVEPDRAWLDEVVHAVGLGDRLGHRPAELSGGQQQRVAAARALVSRPQIVFADEPTGNLDTRASSELLAFMGRAVREWGQTIVMVTHDPMAASYADVALFLTDGRVVDRMDEPTAETVLDRLKDLGN
jgi:putative ABC transport system ATP-binding protein